MKTENMMIEVIVKSKEVEDYYNNKHTNFMLEQMNRALDCEDMINVFHYAKEWIDSPMDVDTKTMLFKYPQDPDMPITAIFTLPDGEKVYHSAYSTSLIYRADGSYINID